MKTIRESEFTLLVALLMSIMAFSIDALLPALSVIGRELHVHGANHAQLVISAIFIGSASGQLVMGPLSDAFGRRPVLFAGLTIYATGALTCFLASEFDWLIAGRVLQGFGVSAPYVTAISVVRDRFAGRQMAKVMSLVMLIFLMVPAIAPSVGQMIVGRTGWRSVFVVYLAYASFVGVWIALRLEETLLPENRRPLTRAAFGSGLRTVFGNRTTVCYMLAMGLCFGALIGYLNSSQQIFQSRYAAGDRFALYFGGLALVMGAASLLNSRIVVRFGMRAIATHAMRVFVGASALFLSLQFLLPWVGLGMFLAYAAIVFFCFGTMFGNLNAVAMEPMGEIAGMASAIIGATSSAISLTLGTTIGQLYDGSLRPITAGFLVLGLFALLLIRMEDRWRTRRLPMP